MKIERLELSNKKVKIAFIVGIVLTAILFIMVNYLVTKAKYRNTESLDLVKGTITYNKADLNIIAMYQEKDDSTSLEKEYVSINKIPTIGYKLSEDSYCEVGKQRVEEAEIIYDGQYIGVNKLSEKGTKCYIYFDSLVKEMLGKLETSKGSKYTIDAMPIPITGVYNADVENPEHKEKIYTTEDNYGTSYVFRGNNDDVNNWVTFAGHTWRIIRINGDGTLRLIYQCAEPNCEITEGETTNIVNKVAYKSKLMDDNTYVGYYYGISKADKGDAGDPTYGEAHSNATPSDVANVVDNWYTENGAMSDYTKYLDGSTGFCNDRVVVDGDGIGQTATSYAPASRLALIEVKNSSVVWRTKQYPTLKCGVVMPETNPTDAEGFNSFDKINSTDLKRDLFTTSDSGRGNEVLTNPIGLITSDEIAMVGGFGGTASTNHWLYTNQSYWTISPWIYHAAGSASVFDVLADGRLWSNNVVSTGPGVRPVINLNADIEFSGGNGKSDSPFVVKTSN